MQTSKKHHQNSSFSFGNLSFFSFKPPTTVANKDIFGSAFDSFVSLSGLFCGLNGELLKEFRAEMASKSFSISCPPKNDFFDGVDGGGFGSVGGFFTFACASNWPNRFWLSSDIWKSQILNCSGLWSMFNRIVLGAGENCTFGVRGIPPPFFNPDGEGRNPGDNAIGVPFVEVKE